MFGLRLARGIRRSLAETALVACIGLNAALVSAQTSVGTISTIAGTGTAGYNGDSQAATSARLQFPSGVAIDTSGNVYVADTINHRVRKIAAGSGLISTVAGTGVAGFSGDDGAATNAWLRAPRDVAVNAAGDLFIADTDNHRIRRVAAGTGIISTVVGSGGGTPAFSGDGGVATNARLAAPVGVALDAAGNIYVADTGNQRIRRVAAGTNIITTLAGTGTTGYNGDGIAATNADLNSPSAVAIDGAGQVYIADRLNHRIRRIDGQGVIRTVAGTGFAGFVGEGVLATSANLNSPVGVAVDAAGDVFVADAENMRVRKLVVSTGRLYTVSGSGDVLFGGDGGSATAAQLFLPIDVTVDASGSLYIADNSNHRIRRVTPPAPTPALTTIAGNGQDQYNGEGPALTVQLNFPRNLALDAAGNLYLSEFEGQRVRRITPAGVTSTIAGTGAAGFLGDGGPGTTARLNGPRGLAVDAAGNVYVADYHNHRIRRITAAGVITTIAGNGTAGFSGDGGLATAALLNYPSGVAIDASGNLYIADQLNNRIRKITASTGVMSTIAGNGGGGAWCADGTAVSASLMEPDNVAVDSAGNVYFSDTGSHHVCRINTSGQITVVAGTGAAAFDGENIAGPLASLNLPTALSVDSAGNVYIADTGNNRVRKLTVSTGILTTVAGTALFGFAGDGGPATAGQLSALGVAVSPGGTLYIADSANNRVRKVGPPVLPPTSLTLRRYGATGVILTWSAPQGANSYIVKRGTTPANQTTYAGGITGTSAYIVGTANTRYYFAVSAAFDNVESAISNVVAITLTTTGGRSDVDGDGASDLVVYRPTTGRWLARSATATHNFPWGTTGDVPMPGDFDGDGKIDPTVYRPSTHQWFILYSSRNYDAALHGYLEWGVAGDEPFAADFDGDGYCDIGVFRPSNGTWYLRLSSLAWQPGPQSEFAWGAAGDVPITGDVDADGRADIGVYRPTTGQWFFRYSSLNYSPTAFGYFEWGSLDDVNLTADFDGDARGDIGVYRPSTGQWFVLLSSLGYNPGQYGYFQWGATGDQPRTGDFDGDGRADVGVYRPTTGQWFILLSSRGYNTAQYAYHQWGALGDISLPTK